MMLEFFRKKESEMREKKRSEERVREKERETAEGKKNSMDDYVNRKTSKVRLQASIIIDSYLN